MPDVGQIGGAPAPVAHKLLQTLGNNKKRNNMGRVEEDTSRPSLSNIAKTSSNDPEQKNAGDMAIGGNLDVQA